MLDSLKITRRQSEIRQQLADLVGKETPTEDETRSMETLDAEYKTNETRFRAALTSEDEEREAAKGHLEIRDHKEYEDLVSRFEVRQVLLNMDTGQALEGATAEVVQEMRSKGRFTGTPVPMESGQVENSLLARAENSSRQLGIQQCFGSATNTAVRALIGYHSQSGFDQFPTRCLDETTNSRSQSMVACLPLFW